MRSYACRLPLTALLLLVITLANVGAQGKSGGAASTRPGSSGPPSVEKGHAEGDKKDKEKTDKAERDGGRDHSEREHGSEDLLSGLSAAPSVKTDSRGTQPKNAKELEAWFEHSGQAARLGEPGGALLDRARAAISAGVPAAVFSERLREAAAKGVAPATAVAAITVDSERLARLAAVLSEEGWPPGHTAVDFYLAAAAAMRSGLSEGEVVSTAVLAAEKRRNAKATGVALTTAAAASSVFGVPLTGLASGLVGSSLYVNDYSTIVELAHRAIAESVDAERFMEVFNHTIGRGASLWRFRITLF